MKTALITGAASGIGYAVAEYLALEGYTVWATDRDLAQVEAAAAKMSGKVVPFKLDVTSQEEITAVITAIERAHGRLDVLLNNAGIQHVAPLEEFPVDLWQRVSAVLLNGPAMLTRAALPLMRAKNFGRIVNIGSIHSLVASPYKSAYVAAKHGLIGFAKVVALETAAADITINTICPAYVKTALVEQQIADQAKSHGISADEVVGKFMLEPMPKQRFITLAEICAAVGYLVGDGAGCMTGQTLVLDGGWTVK